MTGTLLAIGAIVGASVGFLAGWLFCLAFADRDPCQQCREWQALVDDLDGEVRDIRDGLATADATIKKLSRDVDMAWQAGIVQGQLLQAERQEWNL